MRFFNTTGPVNPADHYCLSPLQRLELEEILLLIEQKKYFVLHAPRQTGKTSALLALMEHLNAGSTYRCVYVNVEVGQAAREDVSAAMQAVLARLGAMAARILKDSFVKEVWRDVLAENGPFTAFGETLSAWSEQDPKPLVVLIDEIDTLVGDTLIAVLRQLREGYVWRPAHFPQSVVLCGVRDVRDYRIRSGSENAVVAGGSAFNVKAESLRLGDFSRDHVAALYRQHAQETGQAFTAEALARTWELTQGQPWLVNALAFEACFKTKEGRDRRAPVALEQVEQAKERLILRRETHLDQLADKLREERVRRVIEPLLGGSDTPQTILVDDLDYVRDLGLVRAAGTLAVANPIYREIIPRQLTYTADETIDQHARWYVEPASGRLDTTRLLTAFQQFFREHAEHWAERFQYQEAGPQLLMQAFLQRIANGGGRIEREYGLGRMRTDLLMTWPCPGGTQRIVLELKVLHKGLAQTERVGLEQTWQCMDRCGADEGHLVVFDRSVAKPWEEKLFQRDKQVRGRLVKVWGM